MFFHKLVDFLIGEENVVPTCRFLNLGFLQLFQIDGNGSKAQWVGAVLIRLRFAVCCQRHIGVLQNIVLQILHRSLTPDKQESVPIVQHPHLVRGHQLPACGLEVGGVAAAAPFGLSVSVCINCLLAQQLGNILVGGLLIAAQIQKAVMR